VKAKRVSSFQVTWVEGSEDVSLLVNTVAPDFATEASPPYTVHREDVALLHAMLGKALEDFDSRSSNVVASLTLLKSVIAAEVLECFSLAEPPCSTLAELEAPLIAERVCRRLLAVALPDSRREYGRGPQSLAGSY
jgi:hypothetical protein